MYIHTTFEMITRHHHCHHISPMFEFSPIITVNTPPERTWHRPKTEIHKLWIPKLVIFFRFSVCFRIAAHFCRHIFVVPCSQRKKQHQPTNQPIVAYLKGECLGYPTTCHRGWGVDLFFPGFESPRISFRYGNVNLPPGGVSTGVSPFPTPFFSHRAPMKQCHLQVRRQKFRWKFGGEGGCGILTGRRQPTPTCHVSPLRNSRPY